MSVETKWMDISPDMASEWLKIAAPNRGVSAMLVAQYARDMGAPGHWRITAETIKFDESGMLIDGQHRLLAIVKSGRTIRNLVAFGLERAAQNVIDGGRKRSWSDQQRILGNTNAPTISARAKQLLIIQRNLPRTPSLSFAEQDELVRSFQFEIEWSMVAFPSCGGLGLAPIASAWAYARGATKVVDQWVASFVQGTDLKVGDPIYRLRNALSVRTTRTAQGINRGTFMDRKKMTLIVLRALYAKVQGTSLAKLYDSTEGLIAFARMRGDMEAVEAWSTWTTKRMQDRGEEVADG